MAVSSPSFRRRSLPRDARDTLFLLAVILWTVLPHVGHLPPWCIALTGLVLVWRAHLAFTNAPLPPRWLPIAALATATALTLLSFRTLFGKDPGVTMAVVLMALKTLELRARRDAFVVFFLGFFLVLTHFLYSQSIGVAAAMLVSVWGLLTALVLAHLPVGQPSLKQAGSLALRTAALGAPIMVLLFVMFPRIGPLWGVPQAGLAGTGLSNSMNLGSVGELAVDERIAMRVRFPDRSVPGQRLYFRGPVLTRFDGVLWTPLSIDYPLPIRTDPLVTTGAGVRYEITLEPASLPLLPLLEATPDAPSLDGIEARRREDLGWALSRLTRDRLRFTAVAFPEYQLNQGTLTDRQRQQTLQLPDGVAPRTRAWAEAFRARPDLVSATPAQLAAALFRHIRTDQYTYTLTPGVYGEADSRAAIDEFWLDRKQGFCEHFAASFVVVMRSLGVPARIVTGYQGAEAPDGEGWRVVRHSNAHAWAEYWQEDLGWVRADPTAAVAPDRIFSSRNLRPTPGFAGGALATLSPDLLPQLRSLWESLDNRWNQWVLNYSRGQQLDALARLGIESPSWQDLAKLLVLTLSGLALVGVAWAWWDRQRQDPWQRQAAAVAGQLRRLGLPALPHQPPRQLAGEVREKFGPPGEPLAALLMVAEHQRYGRAALARPSRAWLATLRTEARRLLRTTSPR
ncbi:transglutaminaseTgpA domain-containing protein [Piscinibacter gummiphilus]|uniref:transglutaminase family protein n=1 Tax=Piscinibacter gummiphilus TaxID=946333 RepID=UPI001F3EF29E|nr:DUF3488 and transglutaminase-like domain-containing protein [Piscinibacter gummiphilus]GLS96923.1 protein-glutamine gamma-glutamyltransferase [Piscinibacter gummiphilus]